MNIKIFLCYHKDYGFVPPLCMPIQGGRAISQFVSDGLGDDTGDNISHKNREYCELTVQYYAYKNEYADYYGFCHYRRFFCLNEKVRAPYLALGDSMSARTAADLLGDREAIERLCSEYDIIVPRSEKMGSNVREHYCSSEFHYREDLELFLQILSEQLPQLEQYAEEYLNDDRHYFCNMFIMHRDKFREYCGMLFPLLEEFDKRKSCHGDFQSDRTDGYLAERFVGIYLAYARAQGAQIKELPRLDVYCSFKKRLGCFLLPPESRRRLWLKSVLKRKK